jgi:hypothetical protein
MHLYGLWSMEVAIYRYGYACGVATRTDTVVILIW